MQKTNQKLQAVSRQTAISASFMAPYGDIYHCFLDKFLWQDRALDMRLVSDENYNS